MLSILLMLGVLVACPTTREPPQFYILLSTAILSTVIILHILLGGSPVLWIVMKFTRDQGTVSLQVLQLLPITVAVKI